MIPTAPAVSETLTAPDRSLVHRRKGASDSSASLWVEMPKLARFAAIGVLIVYTVVCVVGALLNTTDNPASPFLALSNAVYLAALIYPLLVFKKEEHGWFHPLIFSTLYAMVRILPRRINLSIFGLESHAVLPLSHEDLTRLVAFENLLNALALVGFYFGYHHLRNIRTPRLRTPEPKHLWLVVAVFGVISLVALALYARLAGSFSQHLLNITVNSASKVFVEQVDGVGHLITVAIWFAFALNLALAYQPQSVRRPLFWLLSLVALCMIYLVTGKRAFIFAHVAMGAVTWMIVTRRVPLVRLALLGGCMFVVFSLILFFRGVGAKTRSAEDFWTMTTTSEGLSNLSFGASIDELNERAGSYSSAYPILHYVPSDDYPLLWGDTYLLIFGRPIPRAIWPGKPRGADYRAGAEFFNAIWGIPPGPVAEAFWNFHIPGVFAIFFLFGGFMRWLANLRVKYPHCGVILVVYAYTILNVAPCENNITNALQSLIPIVIFVFVTGAIRVART